jgi:hypothetical protein
MPRKKLTKTQVKRKYKQICSAFYDMMLDKLGHTDSNVGMSVNKLLDLHKVCQATLKRMK